MATYNHTPHGRGFDSSLIYFEHKIDYWDHTLAQSSCTKYNHSIRDLWAHNGTSDLGAPARDVANGTYVEYAFRDRVLDIIEKHDMSTGPLYLQYDPHIAHCPLQVPQDWLDKFNFGNDEKECQVQTAVIFPGSKHTDYRCRNQYEAMVALLDEVLGNVTAAIKAKGWWDETLMVLFSCVGVVWGPACTWGPLGVPLRGGLLRKRAALWAPFLFARLCVPPPTLLRDNGGPIDVQESGSNNWPLRGGKYTQWEGLCLGFEAGSFL